MLKIPTEFKLLGHTIIVRFDNKKCEERSCYAFADYNNLEIILSDEYDGNKVPKSLIYHSFIHEKIHFILDFMNEHKINNEKFVDLISGMLFQAESTSKYDESPN